MEEIDVYSIAHKFIEEYGEDAITEIDTQIHFHSLQHDDGGNIKTWYDVKDAIQSILEQKEAVAS